MSLFSFLLIGIIIIVHFQLNQSQTIVVKNWKREGLFLPFHADLFYYENNHTFQFTFYNDNNNDHHNNQRNSSLCPEQNVTLTNLITSIPEDLSFLLKNTGPDELLLQIEGKVLLSFLPHYLGCGVYQQFFHIPESGFYHFSLARFHEDYGAVIEDHSFPFMKYEEFISEWIRLTATKEKEIIRLAPIHNHNYHHQQQQQSQRSLPPQHPAQTTTTTTTTTRYVDCIWWKCGEWKIDPKFMENFEKSRVSIFFPTHSYLKSDPIFTPITPLNIPIYIPIEYPFQTSSCAKFLNVYSWQMTISDRKYIFPFEAIQLLSKKKIIFSGDSHMRIFVHQLIQYLCDLQFPDEITSYSMIFSHHKTCSSLQFEFNSNGLCAHSSLVNVTTQNHVDELILVINCGHHPAAKPRYRMGQYANTVSTYLTSLEKDHYLLKNMIWLESTPMPIRQDQLIIDHNDGRTLDRIRLFNLLAKDLVTKRGRGGGGGRAMHYLETFYYLLPFINKMCDRAHYTVQGMYTPIIQNFLSLMRSILYPTK